MCGLFERYFKVEHSVAQSDVAGDVVLVGFADKMRKIIANIVIQLVVLRLP